MIDVHERDENLVIYMYEKYSEVHCFVWLMYTKIKGANVVYEFLNFFQQAYFIL